jgi:hypothetical protein
MPSLETARERLATHPLPDNPWIELSGDLILIKTGYTETIEQMLRWVPRVRYSGRRRCWLVPLTGLEVVRSVLPELSRLAEAMQETPSLPEALADAATGAPDPAQARRLFRDCARLLFGSDWQRETARALGRDEAALACWVVGEPVAEATPEALLGEMLALMRRRARDIGTAADALEARLAPR